MDQTTPRTRRAVIAGAVGGTAALAVAALGHPEVARAGSDGDVVLGQMNTSATSTIVRITTPGEYAVQGQASAATGSGIGVAGSSHSPAGMGVYGSADPTTGGIGVFGEAQSDGGVGVQGVGNTYAVWGAGAWTGVLGSSGVGPGVVGWSHNDPMGTAPSPNTPGKTGVYGYADQDTAAMGVYGQSTSGMGVLGKATTGTGIRGESATGVDLAAGGSGRLLQKPTATAGAPGSGTYATGEMIRDATGAMWLCTAGGKPGTWRKVASVASGSRGGALTLLPTPARVYDSRSGGGAMTAGSVRTIYVASAIAAYGGALAVPGGAVGVTYNLTVTGTVAGGWLALLPRGATFGGTASINWTASGQTIANGGVVGLGGDRQLDVRCATNSGCSTHFILDLTGYYI